MASRIHVKAAGRRVSERVQALSDALAAHEESTKLEIEALFSAAVQPVISLTTARGRGRRGAERLADALAEEATAAVTNTGPLYGALAAESVRQGLTSLRGELLACEQAMSRKYAGLADESVDRTSGFATSFEAIGADLYLSNAATVIPWFRDRVVSEILSSTKDDTDTALDRIVWPDPLPRLPDHSGRGLWWKVLEHCHRITRETQFATMNAVRSQAMARFNTLGEDR